MGLSRRRRTPETQCDIGQSALPSNSFHPTNLQNAHMPCQAIARPSSGLSWVSWEEDAVAAVGLMVFLNSHQRSADLSEG
jgi:hypothetical protein